MIDDECTLIKRMFLQYLRLVILYEPECCVIMKYEEDGGTNCENEVEVLYGVTSLDRIRNKK